MVFALQLPVRGRCKVRSRCCSGPVRHAGVLRVLSAAGSGPPCRVRTRSRCGSGPVRLVGVLGPSRLVRGRCRVRSRCCSGPARHAGVLGALSAAGPGPVSAGFRVSPCQSAGERQYGATRSPARRADDSRGWRVPEAIWSALSPGRHTAAKRRPREPTGPGSTNWRRWVQVATAGTRGSLRAAAAPAHQSILAFCETLQNYWSRSKLIHSLFQPHSGRGTESPTGRADHRLLPWLHEQKRT